MTCSVSRFAPISAYGERVEYAATMKNRPDSVITNTLISRLPPEKKMPPAMSVNTRAQVTYVPSVELTDTLSFSMSLRTS